MLNWTQCLKAIVLLAIAGFGLVIVSGFWHILALLVVGAALLLWLPRLRR